MDYLNNWLAEDFKKRKAAKEEEERLHCERLKREIEEDKLRENTPPTVQSLAITTGITIGFVGAIVSMVYLVNALP